MEFEGLELPEGSEVHVRGHGLIEVVPSTPVEAGGLVWAAALLAFVDGRVVRGILANDQVHAGWCWAGGEELVLARDRVRQGVLAAPQDVYGWPCRGAVAFDPDGRPRQLELASAVDHRGLRVHGRMSLVDGVPVAVELATPAVIDGVRCQAGPVTFRPSGELEAATLDGDQTLDGVALLGGTTVQGASTPFWRLAGTLAADHELRGVVAAAGTPFRRSGGAVVQLTPRDDVEIDGVRCLGGREVVWQDGRLFRFVLAGPLRFGTLAFDRGDAVLRDPDVPHLWTVSCATVRRWGDVVLPAGCTAQVWWGWVGRRVVVVTNDERHTYDARGRLLSRRR